MHCQHASWLVQGQHTLVGPMMGEGEVAGVGEVLHEHHA